MKEDLFIFIVENEELGKKLIQEYFGSGITYAERLKIEKREEVVKALETIT